MKPLALACVLSALLLLAVPSAFAGTEAHGEWPLRPQLGVARHFDPPAAVWASGHRGVDLRGTAGQPVHSALRGTVSFVGRIAGVGVVVVTHGDTRTTYQPVEAEVRVGRRVAAGAVLGSLEWYGSHCLPAACLHWGLVRGDTYLDPLSLVGGPSPVRLLPLDGSTATGAPGTSRLPVGPMLPVGPRLPAVTQLPTLLGLWE